MQSILTCLGNSHDQRLLILAALVCTIGVYGTSSIARHTGRSADRARFGWAVTSIVAAGCTAWATHMIGLLAFDPGMQSGFDPLLTAVSLLAAIVGIGSGVGLAVGRRTRRRRFAAGIVLGFGVTSLHYLGQTAYLVTGEMTWNVPLAGVSILVSLSLFGLSLMVSGERNHVIRKAGAPLLLAAISVLHFCGLAAATFVFDPQRSLAPGTLSPGFIAPLVAGVSLGLLALAVLGLKLSLAARASARRDRDRLRELASLAVEGLAVCDDEVIMTANQSLEELVGSGVGGLSGRLLGSLLPSVTFSDIPEREERDAELAADDGHFVPVRILRRDVVLGGKRQAVIAVRDQRERLRTEARIRTLAFSDALTGLPNRARFNDLVATHVAAARDRGVRFTVLLIDLDRFKLVNDTLGHAAGDTLLYHVSERLRDIAGGRDLAARLGGDEFAILLATAGEAQDPTALAQRIVQAISQPFAIGGQSVSIGASVGMATAPFDGDRPELLLRNADLALYQAKSDGRGVFRAFDPELDRKARERQEMEADLRSALLRGELEVHYQPLVDARSRLTTSAEALVRWRHPERGMISPAEFIPLAEETGLIGALGMWVLRTACTDATSWPAPIRVAVNLSPAQFRDPRFVDNVLDVLAETALPARRLELEVTEGVLLQEEERTSEMLTRFRDAGMSLALDDFGTGYSSLSYLRRFPFNKIKVDRSFVRHLPSDKESVAIIRAIVAMGVGLGMSTTVEGVETAEQFAFVSAEGCDQVQGYYVSRPLPGRDFNAFLEGDKLAA